MKQWFRLAAGSILLCIPFWLQACDVCGCSGGGNSWGLLPLVQRHFIGLRYQSQGFQTLAHGSEEASSEHFQSFNLWARWQPHRRWQLVADMPYLVNSRSFTKSAADQVTGLGDVSLTAQFALLDPARFTGRSWQHTLQAGAGVKLPTGASDISTVEGETFTPNLQPGTGSTDLLVSGLYALRHNQWGLSIEGSARFTSENSHAYKTGNRVNTGWRVFWNKRTSSATFLPYAGLQLDARDADRDNGHWQTTTGGWAMFGVVGAEIFRKNLAFGLNGQLPVASSLSDGKVTPRARVSASVTMLFGKKS